VKKRVEIHVDELVLHGIPAGQRQAVVEAVQRELARIAAQDSAAQDSAGAGGFAQGAVPSIPPISLTPGRKPS
jgi:hypothetical protein